MTYRYEGEDLIIDGWERGIADGPYAVYTATSLGPVTNTGIAFLSNCNILGVPGEISVEFPLAEATVSGAHSVQTPYHKAAEIDDGNAGLVSNYFLLDSSGNVFSTNLAENGSWTYMSQVGTNVNITGDSLGDEGMVWWKGYLFVIRETKIYYSTDLGATFTDWHSVDSTITGIIGGVSHYAVVSVGDNFFFCNGASVASVVQNAGQTFDPTNTATYVFNASVITIPSWDSSTVLAEVAATSLPQLFIGGTSNRVYVWGETGGSLNNTLFLSENFTRTMVSVNANVYIFSGSPTNTNGRGNIYVTNGSTIDVYKKMPDSILVSQGSYGQEPYWVFGDAIYHRNRLFFGAGCNGSVGGIWALDLSSGALWISNNIGSASNFPTIINTTWPFAYGNGIPGLGYWCSSPGKIYETTFTMSTSYPSVAISDRIPVGTRNVPRTFSQLEIKLAQTLQGTDSIAVSLSTDNGLTFASLGTMLPADGVGKVFTPLNFQASQWLQIKTVSTPDTSNTSYLRIREIRLR